MTVFDPALAAFRFGTGLSPRFPPPGSEGDLLAGLWAPVPDLTGVRVRGFAEAVRDVDVVREARQRLQDADAAGRDSEVGPARAALSELQQEERRRRRADFLGSLAMTAFAPDGLTERLVLFWADHFTTRGKNVDYKSFVTPYVRDAIRPRIAGPFEDLLVAAVTHPMMLHYLDQGRSRGPNSAVGQRTGEGLNENLAREVLELHTLGVGGPYDQDDVRQLAELLTGLTGERRPGRLYDPRRSEPGAETVLGRSYDGESLATVEEALRDLARHPATARHLSGKLVTHFVSDTPDPALVDHVTRAWEQSGGVLSWVMAALVGHPAAWQPDRVKVRRPVEFVAAALRALDPPPWSLTLLKDRDVRHWLNRPLSVMGQPWEEPTGPDGWAEEDTAWITPQGLAGRIDWAMRAPEVILRDLPDPRAFADAALGPFAGRDVTFAAAAAATRPEGVGLVLSSASFNRR